jgi:hypothetical protein
LPSTRATFSTSCHGGGNAGATAAKYAAKPDELWRALRHALHLGMPSDSDPSAAATEPSSSAPVARTSDAPSSLEEP